MTESKTLSLKKPLSFNQVAKISQMMGRSSAQLQGTKDKKHDNENVQVSKKQPLRDAIKWLAAAYPNCFNPQSSRPLKIGILNDIVSKGQWPYPKTFLRKSLGFYVGTPLYLNTLLKETYRVSLEGEIAGEVTAHQKQIAEEWLKKREQKKKAVKLK